VRNVETEGSAGFKGRLTARGVAAVLAGIRFGQEGMIVDCVFNRRGGGLHRFLLSLGNLPSVLPRHFVRAMALFGKPIAGRRPA
jgi:hypothetical protein